MATKNDEKVLKLKEIIDKKRTELSEKKSLSFTSLTNCILDFEGQKYNLNILKLDELRLLLVRMNMHLIFSKDLKIPSYIKFSGYTAIEWVVDIKSKIEIIQHKNKLSELKELEVKLNRMLSEEKKTEMELDEIASLLGKE